MHTLEDNLIRLGHLPRTGWLIRGIELPESVADHTFGVLLIALLRLDHGDLDEAQMDILLPMLLFHDIQEIFTGDLTFQNEICDFGSVIKVGLFSFAGEVF